MIARRLWMVCLLAPMLWADDLDSVKQESDHIKRFERAITLAETETREARQLVKDAGSRADLISKMEGVAKAVSLSLQSLRDTGKRPAKLTGHYKKGELKSREILRQLNDLVLALGVEDRPVAERTRDEVSSVHEDFLLGVMTGK
jgi:hypothetical protein